MRCDEARGPVVRRVRLAELTIEKLRYFYDKLKKFDVLFNAEMPNDFISFAGRFLRQRPDGTLDATGLIWEVDDVGILFMTGITQSSVCAHFTFWDRQLRGREPLIRALIKYGVERYGFERVEVQIGLYARAALYSVERIGFVKEGRLRNSMKYKGEWYDANIYSLLREEVMSWEDQPKIKENQLKTLSPTSPRKLPSSLEVPEESLKIS